MSIYVLHVSLPWLLILLFFIDNVYTSPPKTKIFMRPRESRNNLSKREPIAQSHDDQYFQDTFSEHLSPLKIMFGHVYENPQKWEQRYESRNMHDGIYQGKVQWGNQNGNHGEHYWDFNHRRR